MARTRYTTKTFSAERQSLIDHANTICQQYADQGLTLTLRQLYYQFVARRLLTNEQREYDRLGKICRDAREAGLMDWDHLIDRTRNLQQLKTWDSPAALMRESAEGFLRDLWAPQRKRLEVWIEKDAAIGVIEGVCRRNSVPFFSCRGYTSASEVHQAAQRLRWHVEAGHEVTVFHIGDHDPSGLDMSRDIEDRLNRYINNDWYGLHQVRPAGPRLTRGDIRRSMREHLRNKGTEIAADVAPWRIKRIALNYDQIEAYQPPPNPAKTTDARYRRYREDTGLDESWELDALDPVVLQDLVQDEVDQLREGDAWADAEREMEGQRQILAGISAHWDEIARLIETKTNTSSANSRTDTSADTSRAEASSADPSCTDASRTEPADEAGEQGEQQ
jgi:hypothetical protein